MGHFIQELTYPQLRPLLTEDAVVVLPIGGGAKEHGSHLPMGTDLYVTDWVAREVTSRCDVLTLPTLPYAYFPAFVKWEGSVSVDYPNFIAYVKDILMTYIRVGVKKFLIIDGGVSTHAPLMLLAKTLDNEENVKVAVSDITTLAAETEKALCKQKQGGHGDEAETSCMLHIRKDLVHMEETVEEYVEAFPGAVVGGKTKIYVPNRMKTPHGINGNSTLATGEKGEQILLAMVDALEEFLKNFIQWDSRQEQSER